MISRIEFFLSETFLSLRRHPAMAFAASICVAATLFVAGMVALTILNADRLVDNAMNRVRFVVFFKTDVNRETTRKAYSRICALEKVDSAQFIKKETAWEKNLKERPSLELVGENPLPDSVVVKAVSVRDIPELIETIKRWKEVDAIRDAPEVSSFLLGASQGVRYFGSFIGILLGVIALVIIHHTIELTLYARRKEIHIMSLVGATPSTVALPFLLEGIIYGLIGGGIGIGALWLLYNYLSSSMQQFSTSIKHAALMPLAPILTEGILIVLAAGVLLGLIGSTVSVLKYLHQPRSKMTNA